MFRRKPPTPARVDWLVVGLGNPGAQYRGTRHNVGFEVVERLAERNRIKLNKGRHRALVGSGQIGGAAVALARPLTYMNLSGQSVAPLARELAVPPERVLVAADDLDLPLGKVKMKLRGGSGGHNGHKSVIAALGTEDYPRIKVGIGKVDSSETVDHVLSAFGPEERDAAERAIQLAAEVAERVVSEGWDAGLRLLEQSLAKQ